MPELPEVETVVRSLRPKLVGARMGKVSWSGLGLRLGRPPDVAAMSALTKRAVVTGVRRLAKYILIDVATQAGKPRGTLLVHLGMSGRLQVVPSALAQRPHTHVVVELDGGRELRFVDPRRFGWVAAAANDAGLSELTGLGPDPLSELTAESLLIAMNSSRAPIKAFLLDQRRVAGLGNIYVCEALFRAQLHPTRAANRVRKDAGALVEAIRHVLTLGIENRGTTLRDYVDGDGNEGGNTSALLVYGREGLPCVTCKTPIRRRVDAGRSTFYCPRCQRR
ncbi:MAG TPA: bifunctional DNA-formamidopyrimidine glycosylase/DNA-(apurinic or apyrimidinic site) lyase [Polyangia bacterium]